MYKNLIFAALVTTFMSGCIVTKVENPKAQAGELQEFTTAHWLWGLGEQTVNATCPRGIASIAHGQTFGNAFLQGVTLGIYNPNTVRVTCAK